jgi:excisionase family DNA binding protein
MCQDDIGESATSVVIDDEPLMSSRDLATFLGVPVTTLDQWAYRRTGPRYFRVGRHRRYRRTDVSTWLETAASVTRS